MREATHIETKHVGILLMALIKALGYKVMQKTTGGYGTSQETRVYLVKEDK